MEATTQEALQPPSRMPPITVALACPEEWPYARIVALVLGPALRLRSLLSLKRLVEHFIKMRE